MIDGGGDTGGGYPRGLLERLEALEERIASLDGEVRTRRLALVGDGGHERLVAEIVAGVTELRLDLPDRPPGGRTSLLVFAVPDQPDWCAGLGVQLWVDGDLVDELTWWADADDRRAGSQTREAPECEG